MVFARAIGAAVWLGILTCAAAQNVTLTGLKGCDALLIAGLGSIVVFPADDGYNQSVSTYYSGDNRLLQPNCIVQPRSTEEVSNTVKALGSVTGAGRWEIAVRSGGHSDYDNNAVHRGVTIDLSFFNSVTLSNSTDGINDTLIWNGTSTLTGSIVQLRPAARWGDVYSYLEPYGLSTTGGRSGHVGVGGLLVSGGASYYTQLWGLSCDNVVNYEIVLADGSIVNANPRVNPDLYRALKGGGSNLGIVTRFDLRTYTIPTDGAYGGLIFTSWDQLDIVIDQFVSYVGAIGSGHPDHEFIVYQSDSGIFSIMGMLVSTDGNVNSSAFAPFSNIPLTVDLRSKQPLSSIAATISDTGGSNYISHTLSLQATTDIMKKASELFQSITQELINDAIPASVIFVFQPLPKMLASVNPAGNILGLADNLPADSVLFEVRATLDAGDAAYEGVTQIKLAAAVQELRDFSASLDDASSYIYMNYANAEQDVISSYGVDNVEFLRKTAAKYDPTGFFQYRVPGGWKVSRVV